MQLVPNIPAERVPLETFSELQARRNGMFGESV